MSFHKTPLLKIQGNSKSVGSSNSVPLPTVSVRLSLFAREFGFGAVDVGGVYLDLALAVGFVPWTGVIFVNSNPKTPPENKAPAPSKSKWELGPSLWAAITSFFL